LPFPSEYYIRYLTYISKTPSEICQILKDKHLGRNITPSEITTRQLSFRAYLTTAVADSKSIDDILIESGIKLFVDHFRNNIFNADVVASFGILSFLPAREYVDKAIIFNESFDKIANYLQKEFNILLSVKSIEVYSWYFWNYEFSRQKWYDYLVKHDTFGYLSLFENSEEEKIFKSKFNFIAYDKTEYDFIARKTYDKLKQNLLGDSSDPDICSKWFKIFESARPKSNLPTLVNDGKGNDNADGFELGMTDMPNMIVKSLEDFINPPKDDDTNKDPNKQ